MDHSEQSLAVLFIDVTDSTGIYARRGDHQAYRLISSCLDLIERAIRGAGCRPIKRIGDEVLAVAPSPELALVGSLMARDAVASSYLAEERMRVRAGLSYGPVVLAHGDVHGETVIVAARLAGVANSNEILLSESAREALPPQMREATQPIAPIRLRGWHSASAVFQCVARGDDVTKIATRAVGTSTQALELDYEDRSFRVNALFPCLRIGRADDNEIVLRSEIVSHYHAVIEHFGDRYILADRSTNGTYVHASSGERVHLMRSQTIILGEGQIFPGSLRLSPISYAVRRVP
jgi:class 3 adenylate cyclase